MHGDKLVLKKIAESSMKPALQRVLSSIYQYETDKGKQPRGPYKEHYRAVIKDGVNEIVASDED